MILIGKIVPIVNGIIFKFNLKLLFLFCPVLCFALSTAGQNALCDSGDSPPLSRRLANYKMEVSLDHQRKLLTGNQYIEWINDSPDTVSFIRMYMYLNAFKNSESSYLKGSGMSIMGQDLSSRTEETWGYINISEAIQEGEFSDLERFYVQDLDDNTKDQTVLQLNLLRSIMPGDTLKLKTKFTSKLPKTISRVGYSTNDFFHFVHWYPKLGIYEQDANGKWGWNCHQFLRQMEFYGEFGNYDLTITCADHLKVGASGCRSNIENNADGTRTHTFSAHDVIDFAWCAYPDFIIYEDHWNGIDIELLSPPQHSNLVPRLIGAVKNSLEYLTTHIGPYPYPKITIMDPPALGLRSGFMEYPSYITGGSFYAFPKGIKTIESLIAHEFSHQYFMAILATNEKESPWMDEGFVTFLEDCIMEAHYSKEASLFDIGGYKVSNCEFTRIEYTSLPNKRISKITEKSWKVPGSYKGIVYSKTATVLQTVKNMLGDEIFFNALQDYFEKYKFSHPVKNDFFNSFYSSIELQSGRAVKESIASFMEQALEQTVVCDFTVSSISNLTDYHATGLIEDNEGELNYQPLNSSGNYYCTVTVQQLGDMRIPTTVKVNFENGESVLESWDGRGAVATFNYERKYKVISAEIDPDHHICLDIDLNNNSMTINPNKMGIVKYASRAIFWVQNILQSVSFLM